MKNSTHVAFYDEEGTRIGNPILIYCENYTKSSNNSLLNNFIKRVEETISIRGVIDIRNISYPLFDEWLKSFEKLGFNFSISDGNTYLLIDTKENTVFQNKMLIKLLVIFFLYRKTTFKTWVWLRDNIKKDEASILILYMYTIDDFHMTKIMNNSQFKYKIKKYRSTNSLFGPKKYSNALKLKNAIEQKNLKIINNIINNER